MSDASGSKYSSTSTSNPNVGGAPPPIASKPAFTPTRSSGGAASFNPLAASNPRLGNARNQPVDQDGWGQDAPQVTRTQLEKVQPAYQPTKVNMHELSSQNQEPSQFNGGRTDGQSERSDVVKGGYQPIGKVDIAALRRQAQESKSASDDRPTVVKGSYEPVGKVDIAAIRAKAQRPSESDSPSPARTTPSATGTSTQSGDEPKSLPDRSVPLSASERLTTLPKPKVANRFGSGTGNFAGTKAPVPGGFGLESKTSPTAPPVGASRTFADEGGKTPAQLWAEKKARERGTSSAAEQPPSGGLGGPASPMRNQTSGGNEWKSGYSGKSWAPVQTTKTGGSASDLGHERTGHDEEQKQQGEAPRSPIGGVGAIRDRFRDTAPMGAAATGSERSAPSPPPLDTSNKPNASRGIPIPGLPTRPADPSRDEGVRTNMPLPPPQPPRSPTPPTPTEDSGSPIRVAMPVSRGAETEIEDAREEQYSPPPAMPARSMAQAIPHEDDLTDEPSGHDPARSDGAAVAAHSSGQEAAGTAHPDAHESGKRALVQYDYEKAEDNELELHEGEYVTNIEMVDEDWWMGQNSKGETGLFPSNYVELVEGEGEGGQETARGLTTEPEPHHEPVESHTASGAVATALYDYEAAEDNELTFPEGAKITGVVRANTFK